jgi:valyl-tRNA synthetase
MITAPEILFFWVARMIMAGYEFMREAPFNRVYLHGTVRDKQGRKMSKSLGNGVDPMEVVDIFGADALRFTLLSSAGIGTDITLDHEDLEASFAPGRNFANKLWNAGRFALMSLGEEPVPALDTVHEGLELEDRWILSRLQGAVSDVSEDLGRFRLHEVSDRLYHFVWGDFADWYLELIKPRMQGGVSHESLQAARATLVTVLDGICRLLHPLTPFVTSALWDRLPSPGGEERPDALMIAPWPSVDEGFVDPDAEARLTELQELITQVRSLRKEYGVSEGAGVTINLTAIGDGFRNTLETQGDALRRLARVDDCALDTPADGVGAHAVLKNGAELFMPLKGVIDIARERERLEAEINRLRGQLEGSRKTLGNERFVQQAPAEVVEKEREKARSFEEQLDKLTRKLATLADG